jgi:signal transduction histidine kinase/ActR/RegA family two-component response regulator
LLDFGAIASFLKQNAFKRPPFKKSHRLNRDSRLIPMFRWWRRLTLSQQIVLAGALTFWTLIGGGYFAQTRVVNAALENHARQQAEQLAQVVSLALVRSQQPANASPQAVIDAMVQPHGLFNIEVFNAVGILLVKSKATPNADPHHPPLADIVLPLMSDGQTIGQVRMQYSHASVDVVMENVFGWRVFATAVAFLVTSVLLFIAGRLIGRPVQNLSEATARMAEGDYEVDLGTNAPSQELRTLQLNFETLRQAIRQQIKALREGEALQRRYLVAAQANAHDSDRARQAAQMALRQAESAKEQALLANKAKSEFLGKVSHEIRTPLNGMLGMLQLLQDSPMDARQKETAAIALQSGDALLAIINDLLDVSKIESAGFSVSSAPIDLPAELESVIQLFAPLASRKGLVLQLHQGAGVPRWVMGDGLRLKQVVSNLVSNAIKFTQTGRIDVYLSAPDIAADTAAMGETFSVRVSDTGTGMTAESLQRIFEPFVQVDNSDTRRFGGTGLGLSIVKALVQAMGGTVQVSSVSSQGSSFEVLLPLVKANAPSKPPAAVAFDLHRFDGLRVLVAEDNDINTKLVTRMLERFGCEVHAVADGQRALEALHTSASTRPFGVVLMDCQMPVLDGYEAARKWRDAEKQMGYQRLPIIAVTANAATEDAQRCLDAGMDEVVAKPYAMLVLNAALARWIKASS